MSMKEKERKILKKLNQQLKQKNKSKFVCKNTCIVLLSPPPKYYIVIIYIL